VIIKVKMDYEEGCKNFKVRRTKGGESGRDPVRHGSNTTGSRSANGEIKSGR